MKTGTTKQKNFNVIVNGGGKYGTLEHFKALQTKKGAIFKYNGVLFGVYNERIEQIENITYKKENEKYIIIDLASGLAVTYSEFKKNIFDDIKKVYDKFINTVEQMKTSNNIYNYNYFKNLVNNI